MLQDNFFKMLKVLYVHRMQNNKYLGNGSAIITDRHEVVLNGRKPFLKQENLNERTLEEQCRIKAVDELGIKENLKAHFDGEARSYVKDVFIGVDIEDIGRFAELDLKNDKYYCLSKSNPYPHLAVRFAGKEAIIKLISSLGEKIFPNEIEIVNDANGGPLVNINNKRLNNIKVKISLSHCKDKAIAFAVVLEVDKHEK
jgi:holo-[acyl-carrier protein] synthase